MLRVDTLPKISEWRHPAQDKLLFYSFFDLIQHLISQRAMILYILWKNRCPPSRGLTIDSAACLLQYV